ncbi:phosphatidylglycerol lysyltransferase domain-containing protein [Microbacterium sp. M28]|uniref:bifunctional lysylphosphatidylglycerol flippase/synthetase MprF n=1 Tax=Microbacterium sp. M28 TaxID=2962064 RepID=UPI0021F4BD4E|nr:phosphatidylglycerol lysyltransferase domain-containing protein [Microbacterium sp. M28]UYO96361.1 phosphatidylglycerol lysyltransferase domain-containing protein [Microbacterium sp. M28]
MTRVTHRFAAGLRVVLTRFPVTLALVLAILVCGVVWRGLWMPFEQSDAFDAVAYGLPALEAGRWWTPITGTFFVVQPWVYLPTLIGLWGLAVLEYLRGWKIALLYFWIGQLFAVFASALVLWLCALAPQWHWAQEQAGSLDVGASAGAFACMGAAAGLLRSPWRVRVWLVLIATATVALLFLGTVADLEHMTALLLVLFVDRSLRVQRTTVREQRLIAFIGMLAFAAIDIIFALVPTDGPFGTSEPLSGSPWTTVLDVVIILVIANGLRRARRWAWVIALILLAVNVLLAALLAALIALERAVGIEDAISGDVSIDIATGAVALVLMIYLIWVRRAFHARRRGTLGAGDPAPVDEVKETLRAHGGGTLSWMTTWEGMQYSRTSAGLVAYQRHAGVAIALADPLGPEAGRAESVGEFIAFAERAGLTPCFFSAGEPTCRAVPASWRSLVVADDTIVDLVGLEFTGKRWGAVRTSMNRAGREDMTFRMSRLQDEPWGVRAQLQAISASWVGDKGLPEMGFTLGTLDEAEDPEVRVALAVSPSGDVDGFLSWLPVYGEGAVRGWTLDLMRRRDGGFPPVMEYLIGMSAAAFRDEGAQIMSLSGAPLAHDYPPDARMIAELSTRLADALEPLYGFRSLHRFKEKFHPRYETLHLLYRDEADLPRIGAALTRAFLPDATLRQFAGAGLDLVQR